MDGDLGEKRLLPTPEKDIINSNLNTFKKRWANVLSATELSNTVHEINNLQNHIEKGCLSSIGPGEGTEGNEGLHRILNRSLLRGASTIGPELALAVLSALFYGYNSKRKGGKHTNNAKVTPVTPIDVASFRNKNSDVLPNPASHMNLQDQPLCLDGVWTAKENNGDRKNFDNNGMIEDSVLIADHVDHILNEKVGEGILKDAMQLHDIITNLDKNINDRSYNAFDVLLHNKLSESNLLSSSDDVQSHIHLQNLQRNLSSMSLCIDPVVGDGDCAFTSIVKQLHKLTRARNNNILKEHLCHLGLEKSENEDAFLLRQLFVDTVQGNEDYQALVGIPREQLNEETELFREPGIFCGNLGDLVIRVCADILKVPIFVITSFPEHQYIPFIPDSVLSATSLFIAYNSNGAGHYDGVKSSETPDQETATVFCSCGKNRDRGNVGSCKSGKGSCPCVKRKVSCSRKCICRNCCNADNTDALQINKQVKVLSCRCGENAGKDKNGSQTVACRDGDKKSKCPCLGNGQGCTVACKCKHCGNQNGTKPNYSPTKSPSGQRKRKRNTSNYKRAKSCKFLAHSGFKVSTGSWTSFECTTLAAVLRFLSLTVILPSANNIAKLYNYVVSTSIAKSVPHKPCTKTISQISAKIAHLERKKEVTDSRLPS